MKRPLLLLFLCVFFSSIYAQDKSIKGNVTDFNGEPLPGVSVVAEGPEFKGTITDAFGNYSISIGAEVESLKFSFIGMLTEIIQVESKLVIDLVLVTDLTSLDEVVVIGYGTQKKSDIISSVVTVKPESMTKVPSTDVGEMLRGKAPGVFVTVGDASPGSSSNILIRGKSSINGGNNPIVIADGVPVGSINDINPNDIASLEVLKDAAAQAIYGARASNGVILITTKRGTSGETKVSYNGYYGSQTVERGFDTYSAEEFIQLRREAYRTDNGNEYLPDENIFTNIEQEVMASGEYIDWEKEVLRVAPIQNHNLSVSSGTEKTKVFSSLNYMDQQGVVPGTDYKKATIRLNVDQNINKWLNMGVNTSWQVSENNDPGTGNTLKRTITTSPLGKIYNDDGSYRLNPTGVQESFNPLLDISETSNFKEDRNDIMNVFIDITPFEGFKYRMNGSRRSWNQKSTTYSTANSVGGLQNDGQGQGNIQFQDNVEMQLENIFTYHKSLDVHNLDFTFVQSISQKDYTSFSNQSTNHPNDVLGIYGLEAAQLNTPSILANSRGLLSFVGRVQYDYMGKYYATASVRGDGSTVFAKNNKWGYFPAAALGWNVHREDFLAGISHIVSNLKLRASYGSVGNEAIPPYGSQSTADQRDYIFNNVKRIGFVPGVELPNPDLRWETSTTLNLALDIGLWKDRLSSTLELYNTRTNDLLVKQSLQASTGYEYMWSNLGEIENKGIELGLNGVIVSKKDLSINAGLSFSTNRNKIISLYSKDEDGDGVEDDDLGNTWFIGQPIDVYFQWEPVGIFQEGEDIINSHQPDMLPGGVKLYDRDPTDGILNATDKVITKKDPDWYGSFNLGVNYKNFDFSADILTVQGIIKNNAYLYGYSEGASLRGVFNGVKQDYWTPENPTGNWPRPSNANDPRYLWTMGLQDASYVRLQNLTVGYSLSDKMLDKLKLSKLRIYCTGHNLVTITNFQSYSPEKSPEEYPEAVSIVGGLQISF